MCLSVENLQKRKFLPFHSSKTLQLLIFNRLTRVYKTFAENAQNQTVFAWMGQNHKVLSATWALTADTRDVTHLDFTLPVKVLDKFL